MCTQQCALPNSTTKCEHVCQALCHDAVKVSIVDKNFKPAGPWDVQMEKVLQQLANGEFLLTIQEHCVYHSDWNPKETASTVWDSGTGHLHWRTRNSRLAVLEFNANVVWTCVWSQAKMWQSYVPEIVPLCDWSSIQRGILQRQHIFRRLAETTFKIPLQEQENCANCTEGCNFSRPNGCFHKCPRPCHADACNECSIRIKVPCHCTVTQVYYQCGDFYRNNLSAERGAVAQEKMQSCGNRCIKMVRLAFDAAIGTSYSLFLFELLLYSIRAAISVRASVIRGRVTIRMHARKRLKSTVSVVHVNRR